MYLGHPIANDIMYGGSEDFLETKIAYSRCQSKALQSLFKDHLEPSCPRCTWIKSALEGDIDEDSKPRVSVSGIWLHSSKYELYNLGRTFEAPNPPWAESN